VFPKVIFWWESPRLSVDGDDALQMNQTAAATPMQIDVTNKCDL